MIRPITITIASFLLLAGCIAGDGEVTPLDAGIPASTLVCPPPNGEGMVSPAISILSITFVVDGTEQRVGVGDVLDAVPGDELEIREIILCAASFPGDGGEVCVDFVPLDQDGREIFSEHEGTHMLPVVTGLMTVPGPDRTWTILANWRGISAVVNHWPPGGSGDPDCSAGRCEHDARMVIGLR